ncbi:MAG: PAS domain S-box protein, partial [Chloroflexota bacterium]
MIHRVHWRITLPVVGLVIIILICAHFGWLSIPVSILFILATSGFVIFSIEKLIAPVKEITQIAQQITELISPDAKINYALENENELEQLSLTFNGMVRQLHSQIEVLQAERMTLNAVLQHMTDGVILVDEQGKIQLFNSAAEHIYGMTANNAIGHTLAE